MPPRGVRKQGISSLGCRGGPHRCGHRCAGDRGTPPSDPHRYEKRHHPTPSRRQAMSDAFSGHRLVAT
eukprot:9073001-Alexandrium_andersonii.AAC.1